MVRASRLLAENITNPAGYVFSVSPADASHLLRCPSDIEKSRYAEEVPWLLHSSHRNWCPRGLPDPECAVGRWIDIHRMPYKCQSLRDAEGCLYDARFMGYYN